MSIDPGTESATRLIVFCAVLAVMGLWEFALPRRDRVAPKARRWVTNFAIVAIDTAVLRIAFPILAVGLAAEVSLRGWGLFGWLDWPGWLEVILCIVILDFAIYLQHVASHKIPALWALHKVHHADRDFDVSTAIRFHPVEIALSMLWKFVVVIALGASPLSVFLFEVLLNATAMFNHANVRLPLAVDAVVRLFVVTPDMHRVHHSVIRKETDSNYGFNLSIWDRLCGTYQAQPEAGHDNMTIGLSEYQDMRPTQLGWSLALPFRSSLTRRSPAKPRTGPAESTE